MALPPAQGLYDPNHEHDACGLGFVARLDRRATHDTVTQALEILARLTHRGAAGCDPCTGDGAGVMLQIPHERYADEMSRQGVSLPAPGDYAVAMCFLSADPARRRRMEAILEAAVEHHGQRVLGWRDVPVDASAIGPMARDTMPAIRQLFIGREGPRAGFDRTLFMVRKRAGRTASVTLGGDDFYLCSCSSRTVVYKGLMLAEQLGAFYPDLLDPRTVTRLAVVHSRFSTNTFPSWERAHPFRYLAHNGEINTLNGNRAWMRAREALLESPHFGEAIEDFKPIIRSSGSDSASLDNVVDFLVASGRSLPHVMMMLVPEASDDAMSPERRAFYDYHACLIEPWDGPAALAFTDGDLVGAMLDRNGLRPAKWAVTSDGLVVLASELGVLPLDPTTVVQKGRVQPGRMFLVDTREGRVLRDEEVKHRVATRQPYRAWLAENRIDLDELAPARSPYALAADDLPRLHQVFGYTEEDLTRLLPPMAATGEEAVGSMGVDAPLAVLSARPQSLFRYFKQQFAQVTNPPIDPIREAVVMSMTSSVGGEGNLLDETPKQCRMVQLKHPVLTNDDVARLRRSVPADFRTSTMAMRFARETGTVGAAGTGRVGGARGAGARLREALDALCREARAAVTAGASLLILSDRDVGPGHVPIPSLLALGAVHHDLIRTGLRMKVGIVVESAEPREVTHLALLVGYGAGAVNPYLAMETVADLARRDGTDPAEAVKRYVKALVKGLQKVMSKMGISAVSSYQGAQIFEAVGVDQALIDRYFTGTSSRIRGVGLDEVAREALARHDRAYGPHPEARLDVGGYVHLRTQGEAHLWTASTLSGLQRAVRDDDGDGYAAWAREINEQGGRLLTLRGAWDLVAPGGNAPVAIAEVEPAVDIVRRFATGAMSFGSISKEAHETLAVAMNRVGARSNTGEGGEDPERFVPLPNGDSRRSAIKQVASGRFGVTAHYLVNADEIQIKMAQGAKPGEGGQLPGHKVDAVIARVRHSTPGVTLISPPPHHDIYSIEDLAQLIFDLRNVNPTARISVKLVSEAGVGTVAAGVAKALADVILISGHDGGTGAAPLTSIHHAGTPWELGLAEAQQVLVLNGLRGRVRLQVDGQLRTGRDVVVGALLGAEEFGFSTGPLVAMGCLMMRKCHLNTCPVGIATQDPELRKRFAGAPEHVIRYLFFVAEEARTILASLGFRALDEAVGRVECIAPKRPAADAGGGWWKARRLDFSEVLYRPKEAATSPLRCVEPVAHTLDAVLDRALAPRAAAALERRERVALETPIRNSDRAFGAMLSGEIARRHGDAGLADDTLVITAHGSAGQSFGAFGAPGLTLALWGEANDYVGKGLSGAVLAVRPPEGCAFEPEAQVIVGNTVLYGATRGRAFFNGRAGERFGVRNSGAAAVVEGVGDHGCEYMTGGTVVVLGLTGRNFAAGMSGGVAYVFDEDGGFAARCNPDTVTLEALDDDDRHGLRALVEEHAARTGSPKARALLGRWAESAGRFVKVMPEELRKALAAQRARVEGTASAGARA
jgi:glutamate synthase (NADPH/NADH) large chain